MPVTSTHVPETRAPSTRIKEQTERGNFSKRDSVLRQKYKTHHPIVCKETGLKDNCGSWKEEEETGFRIDYLVNFTHGI